MEKKRIYNIILLYYYKRTGLSFKINCKKANNLISNKTFFILLTLHFLSNIKLIYNKIVV